MKITITDESTGPEERTLIQVRIPKSLAELVTNSAEASGSSVNSWVQAAIEQRLVGPMLRAWTFGNLATVNRKDEETLADEKKISPILLRQVGGSLASLLDVKVFWKMNGRRRYNGPYGRRPLLNDFVGFSSRGGIYIKGAGWWRVRGIVDEFPSGDARVVLEPA